MPDDSGLSADAYLKPYVLWLMKDCKNNRSEVARILGWSRNRLMRHLRRWEIEDRRNAAELLAPKATIKNTALRRNGAIKLSHDKLGFLEAPTGTEAGQCME
jgi:hypothetical protein